jgi:glycosyltransferase involved in cell wall biosynthesis
LDGKAQNFGMKHICHIIPSLDPESGGPAQAIHHFINATAHLHKHEIFTTNEGISSIETELSVRKKSKAEISFFNYSGTHSYKWSGELWQHLKRNANQIHLMHIHAGFSFISMLTARFCRKNNIPYIYRPLGVFSEYSLSQGNQIMKKTFLPLEIKNLAGACAVHVTSHQEKRDIEALGISGEIISVIPIPLNVSENLQENTKPHHPVRLGFLSRIHPKKNIETLLEACGEFRYGDFVLKMAGNGNQDYIQKLKEQSEQIGISVDWTGFINKEKKTAFWEDIDWLILPSLHENYGIVVAEALSKGVPVIISDQVEICDLFNGDEVGFITGTDSASLVTALEKVLLMKSGDYLQLSKTAFNWSKSTVSYSAVETQLNALYQHCD